MPTDSRAVSMPNVLGIHNIEDNDGNRLETEVQDAFARVEDFIQAHIRRNDDVPDKPCKVTIEMDIHASGVFGRSVATRVNVKLPDKGPERVMLARSQDGLIVTDGRPIRQSKLPFGPRDEDRDNEERDE